MRARPMVAALVAAVVCGCTSDGGLPTEPQVADGVSVRVTVPGRCILSTCTPESDGRNTLGLIEITNSGTADAFLRACGSTIALGEEVLLNGMWTVVGPAVACAAPSTPIRIAAGQTLQFNDFFAPGWRRMGVGVGTSATISVDDAAALSNVFHVF